MQQENGKLFGIFTASTLFSCSSSSLVRPPSSGTFLKFCKTFIVKCGKGLVHFKPRLDREYKKKNYIWLRKTPAVLQPLRDLASKTSQQLRQPRLVLWMQYIENASSSLNDQLHFFWLMRKTKTKTETKTETETETRYQGKKEKQSSSSGRSKLDPRLRLAAYCHHLLVKMFVIITPPNIHYVPPKVDNHPPILKPAPKSRPKKLMIWWRHKWSIWSEKNSLEFIQELGIRVLLIIIIWSSIDAICPYITKSKYHHPKSIMKIMIKNVKQSHANVNITRSRFKKISGKYAFGCAHSFTCTFLLNESKRVSWGD